MSCIVATGQHHTVEQILKAKFHAILEFGSCPDHGGALASNAHSYLVGVERQSLAYLQDSYKIHDFGEGSYLPSFEIRPSCDKFLLPHLV